MRDLSSPTRDLTTGLPGKSQGPYLHLHLLYHKGWSTEIFLKILLSSWSTSLLLHTSSPSSRLLRNLLSQTPRSFSLSQLSHYYLLVPNPSFFALLQDTGAGPMSVSPLPAGRMLGSVHRGITLAAPPLLFRAEAQLLSHRSFSSAPGPALLTWQP